MIKTFAGTQWKKKKKVKDELKAKLPILKSSEVKRFYLPLYEAIIHELEENGYMESVSYLKELFLFDEETRKEAGPGTLTWSKMRLKDNKDALLRLKEGLVAFEQAKNVGDSISMAMEFLNMALFFQEMTWEWWWIAERLYHSALMNAKLIKSEINQNNQWMITLIHYLYGRFLFERIQDTTQSLYHIKIAREASQKKPWNASKVIGREEETIFQECNILLYKALLMHAQNYPDQPDIAVKACTEALARAMDSGHQEYIANTLYELGKSQLRLGDVKFALQNFSKFLAMAKRIPDLEGICNAHMALALAYKLCELDDDINTEKHLCLLREDAAEFGFMEKLAQAHYCTGEHFLSKKKLDIATSHLETSFNLYNELDLYINANKARTMTGVSKGQEIIDQYINLILQCGMNDSRAISMLCEWKNCRKTFWTKEKLHAEESEEEHVLENFETMSSSMSTSMSTSTLTDTMNIAKSSLKDSI